MCNQRMLNRCAKCGEFISNPWGPILIRRICDACVRQRPWFINQL